jgi:predicted nucleotidyltransferase
MTELERIKTILHEHLPELRHEYGVDELGIFGSVARGEAGNDVDVLVTFNRPAGIFALMQVKTRLEELVGKTVDIGTKASIKQAIKDEVLNETQYVEAYGKNSYV